MRAAIDIGQAACLRGLRALKPCVACGTLVRDPKHGKPRAQADHASQATRKSAASRISKSPSHTAGYKPPRRAGLDSLSCFIQSGALYVRSEARVGWVGGGRTTEYSGGAAPGAPPPGRGPFGVAGSSMLRSRLWFTGGAG